MLLRGEHCVVNMGTTRRLRLIVVNYMYPNSGTVGAWWSEVGKGSVRDEAVSVRWILLRTDSLSTLEILMGPHQRNYLDDNGCEVPINGLVGSMRWSSQQQASDLMVRAYATLWGLT